MKSAGSVDAVKDLLLSTYVMAVDNKTVCIHNCVMLKIILWSVCKTRHYRVCNTTRCYNEMQSTNYHDYY